MLTDLWYVWHKYGLCGLLQMPHLIRVRLWTRREAAKARRDK